MAVEERDGNAQSKSDENATVGYDKLWWKTGNLFIKTSRNGQPFGLMDESTPYYVHRLYDQNGRAVTDFIKVEKVPFRAALEKMVKQRKVREVVAGVGKELGGYLIPLEGVIMETLLAIAGIKPPERESDGIFVNSYNDTPITITTDGSFQDKDKISAGGWHSIIRRTGSTNSKDDFNMEVSIGGFSRDNYQAELAAIVDALAYLDTNYEITRKFRTRHAIEIRTDFNNIVDKVKALNEAIAEAKARAESDHESADKIVSPESVDKILGPEEKYPGLWKEMFKFMLRHSIKAIEMRKTPDAHQCHVGANKARMEYMRRVKDNQAQGITAIPKEILHLSGDNLDAEDAEERDTGKSLLRRTASRFLAREDRARISPDEETRTSVIPVKYKYYRLRVGDQERENKEKEARRSDMLILDMGGIGLEPDYGLKLAKIMREDGYANPIIIYAGNTENVIRHYAKKLKLDMTNVIICNKTGSIASMDNLYDTVQRVLKEQVRSAVAERPSAIAPETIERTKSREMELQ